MSAGEAGIDSRPFVRQGQGGFLTTPRSCYGTLNRAARVGQKPFLRPGYFLLIMPGSRAEVRGRWAMKPLSSTLALALILHNKLFCEAWNPNELSPQLASQLLTRARRNRVAEGRV